MRLTTLQKLTVVIPVISFIITRFFSILQRNIVVYANNFFSRLRVICEETMKTAPLEQHPSEIYLQRRSAKI